MPSPPRPCTTLAISVGSQSRQWQVLTTEIPRLQDHDMSCSIIVSNLLLPAKERFKYGRRPRGNGCTQAVQQYFQQYPGWNKAVHKVQLAIEHSGMVIVLCSQGHHRSAALVATSSAVVKIHVCLERDGLHNALALLRMRLQPPPLPPSPSPTPSVATPLASSSSSNQRWPPRSPPRIHYIRPEDPWIQNTNLIQAGFVVCWMSWTPDGDTAWAGALERGDTLSDIKEEQGWWTGVWSRHNEICSIDTHWFPPTYFYMPLDDR